MASPLLDSILLKERESTFLFLLECVGVSALVPSQDFKYSAMDRALDLRTEDLGFKSSVLSSTSHYASRRTSSTVMLSTLRDIGPPLHTDLHPSLT